MNPAAPRGKKNRTCVARVLACLPLAFAAIPLHAGNYSVALDDSGRYWFQKEDGTRFLSIGINHIAPHDHEPPEGSRYYDAQRDVFGGSLEEWRSSVFQIMTDAGFNTIGAWSRPDLNDGTLLETPILYVADYAAERPLAGLMPGFEDLVRTRTRTVIGELGNTDSILGVFLDNEMAWYGKSGWDDNPRHTLLEQAFSLEPGHPGRDAAIGFLTDTYADTETFAVSWGFEAAELIAYETLTPDVMRVSMTDSAVRDRNDFAAIAADAFFETATRVVREELPGTLILGVRFAGNAPDPVIKACAAHCDVVSLNNYRGRPDADQRLLSRYWLLGQKPLLITEYGWRGKENSSGNPNTGGAGSVVPTQVDRGEHYASYVADNLEWPMVLGLHWFEWADQPPQGRFDGEDSNYGVVDIHHNTYDEVLSRMKSVNDRADEIHAASTLAIPTEMPPPPRVLVEPGQFPDRPPFIDLVAQTPVVPHAPFSAPDAEIEMHEDAEGLRFLASTGDSWGAGVALAGPASMAVGHGPAHSVDLDGYDRIVLDAEVPRGMPLTLVLDEAGVDSPAAGSYDTGAGDDGESFGFEPVTGTGERHTWEFSLHDIQPRDVWGCQTGKRRADLHALKGPALVFGPGFRDTEVFIHSLRLER